MLELGGFAESLDAIDGDEEDFNAFNFCLAYDYYCAVVGEDFESLGEDLNDLFNWRNLMHTVYEWLTYDPEIDEFKNVSDGLYNGTILTCNKRTFIDACIEHGWLSLAESFQRDLEVKKQHKVKEKKIDF